MKRLTNYDPPLSIKYHDDKKEKFQSHEMSFIGYGLNEFVEDNEIYINSYDLSDIEVYGATKEEAKERLIKAFDYIMEKLKDLQCKIHNNEIDIEEM